MGREEKSLRKVFPGENVFRPAQVGEVSAGSHQSDFLMWILWFVLLQERKKNESQGFCTVARETVGMFALVCVRGGDADGLQLQLWESRAGARALRTGWGAGNLVGNVQVFSSCCSTRDVTIALRKVWAAWTESRWWFVEKDFTDRSFWQQLHALKV